MLQRSYPRHNLLKLGRCSIIFHHQWLSISGTARNNSSKEDERTEVIDPQKLKCDCVGPPDRISNLRSMKFYVPPAETSLHKHFRQQCIDTQNWNHDFWAEHNTKFQKMKKDFIEQRLKEKYGSDIKERKTLSADEMSEFYKMFLDHQKLAHGQYNREWYRRNFNNLILSARVWLEKLLHTSK